ncbi:hypothetical protein F5050DRAFT_973352 [Lentinula boryana]|uniref:Uncharacterized protein n=1 Tax=Lentinula boryana TaxID=40481 RepID=A0ABQ8Q0R4_9AGAR|nr:hypothetical protein F5050DRAFT_973352 [Lentinula boryana]
MYFCCSLAVMLEFVRKTFIFLVKGLIVIFILGRAFKNPKSCEPASPLSIQSLVLSYPLCIIDNTFEIYLPLSSNSFESTRRRLKTLISGPCYSRGTLTPSPILISKCTLWRYLTSDYYIRPYNVFTNNVFTNQFTSCTFFRAVIPYILILSV